MPSRRPFVALGMPILALLLPVAVASQSSVDLPARDRPLTVEEEELFSVGSTAGDDWENFSTLTGVAFDEKGNLYILDAQNSRVVKVGPRGRFVAELGRAGGGPGEFGLPMSFAVTRSGEVRVFDLGGRGFTVFNPDGSFKDTVRIIGAPVFLPIGGLMSLPDGGLVDRGPTRLYLPQIPSMVGAGRQRPPRPILKYDLATEAKATIAYEAWNPISPSGPRGEAAGGGEGHPESDAPLRAFDPGLFVGVLPDGSIAVSDTTTYSVKVVEPGQGLIRTLRRPFTPREVTRRDQVAERNRQLGEMASRIESGGTGRDFSSDEGGGGDRGSIGSGSRELPLLLRDRVERMEFGEEIPVLAGLAVDWVGRIWIKRTGLRVGEDGPTDVIDREDRYLGTIEAEDFRIPDAFGPGGLAAFIELDELDVPSVVVKRFTLR